MCALSTMSTAGETEPVQKRQKDESLKAVECPVAVVQYNKFMAGVDTGDQLQSYYRVCLKYRK